MTTPQPRYVFVTGPRNGSSYAALTLGIVSVALIIVPVLSSAAALAAIILGMNGSAAARLGQATARTAALWGVSLGVVNLAAWAVFALWWQFSG